jgi:D-alanyl-D-alanine carboxypeptidase/D-alanyl-D-alanine-endopeptidase (penicillin-binding protein 4)
MRTLSSLLALTVLSLAAAAAPARESSLGSRIEALINGPDYRNAHWGILVADQATGAVIYEHNAEKLFSPASSTKLFSVAAALDGLGPDYRFKTPVYRRGEVDGRGVLDGDLILVASGDPTMGGRTDSSGRIAWKDTDHTYAGYSDTAELTEPDPLAGLNDLARQVAAAGIKRVEGDVLVDERLFERAAATGSGPSRVSPIMVNDNLIDLLITPSQPGAPAAVDWRPKTAAFTVDARVETGPPGSETSVRLTSPGPGRIVVRGEIPAGRRPLVRIREVDDPGSFARSLFIEALHRAGVTVDASPLGENSPGALPAKEAYARMPQVALLTSPPFSENARLILKVSHNLHASALPLLLAAQKGRRTLAEGFALQREFLTRNGIDADSISLDSGAGGSRGDSLTPRVVVQLLRSMAARPDFSAYQEALPILGTDGTLVTAVRPDSPARGKVRAKTGTYTWTNSLNDRSLLLSKALAGYMTTARGRKLVFALYVNGTHFPKGMGAVREGETLGRLCEILHAAAPN